MYAKHSSGQLPRFLSIEEIKNPHGVISDFFGAYHIVQARRLLQKWIRSAFAEKSYIGRSCFNTLLDLQQWLIRLLEAGQLLKEGNPEGEKAPEKQAPGTEPMAVSRYYSPHPEYRPWDCFPRHLSRHEYDTPRLVVAKLLSHMDIPGWCSFLEQLFKAATSATKVTSVIGDDDLYFTCMLPLKLPEACQLIHVRERNILSVQVSKEE